MNDVRTAALAAVFMAGLTGQQQAIAGLVRGPDGAPVAAAEVRFLPDPEPAVPALAPYLPPVEPSVVTSGARGSFRCPARVPGMLLVTTAGGLGALVRRCWPSRGVRVELQPLAEVVVGSGSEPFRLWTASRMADGTTRHLPPFEGHRARLPAGSYEVWFEVAEGFGWCRLDLRSGHRTQLRWSSEARYLRASPGASVHPTGFPQVPLLGERQTVTLLGAACRGSFAASWTDRPQIGVDRSLPEPTGSENSGQRADAPLIWPPASTASSGALVVQATGTEPGDLPRAWLLAPRDRGGFWVIGRGRADDQGRVQLPQQSGDDRHWLLLTARDRAPVAAEVSSPIWQSPVKFTSGRRIRCTVTGHDRAPATLVAMAFQAPNGPVLARTRTDERGTAELGPVAGPGRITAEHLHFVSTARELAADQRNIEIQLRAGAAIEGIITDQRGQPSPGVTVTLRDPGGALRPAERTLLSDDEGRFRFAGLPPGQVVMLSAQRVRGGQTWSVQARAEAGERDVRMQLRHEDPRIRPPGGR